MFETIVDRRMDGGTLLRQCQLAELYLLDVFVEMCNKHKLTYFLDSGTLLGAMRHNGFIPWDDDIDVGMPIEDYRKLLKIPDEEWPSNVLLFRPGTAGARQPQAKLKDRCSFICEDGTATDVPCGLFIDIFAYDKFPDLPLQVTSRMVDFCYMAWSSACVYRNGHYKNVCGMVFGLLKLMVWTVLFRITKSAFYVLNLFVGTKLKFLPEFGWGRYSGFDNDDIYPTVKHEFEGKMYAVPNKPEKFLTQKYGDWRQVPPPEQRVWHYSIICPTQAPHAPWARSYVGTASENK